MKEMPVVRAKLIPVILLLIFPLFTFAFELFLCKMISLTQLHLVQPPTYHLQNM